MGANKELLLGSQTPDQEEIFAIEELVFSVQISLQRAMNRNGVSSKELAERLGMTPARVSQIFSSKGSNLTIKTIAKVINALGEEFEFSPKVKKRSTQATEQVAKFAPLILQFPSTIWEERPANDVPRKAKIAA
ncbi:MULTISPECIES: helix-turn-helix domain-containing protein [Rhodobacterales]|uniref:helix-turn-helix domain-containing protein n=1 Tax=Rhodobacterales TaxID=204455 RepID=UPI0015F04DDE|nr:MULTISPECIES: helix-turn-helix transcriptional regulator [Rhodobacterales]MDO6591827.1 helix-turn-helix transcriptional regulator [Yoonia sp. 1_MG-2023]